MNFPADIDAALVRKGLSIAGAAGNAGVSANTLYKVRRGEWVSRDAVLRIADVLDIEAVPLWQAVVDNRLATTKDAA